MKKIRTPDDSGPGPNCPACSTQGEERQTVACKADGSSAWICTGCGALTFREEAQRG